MSCKIALFRVKYSPTNAVSHHRLVLHVNALVRPHDQKPRPQANKHAQEKLTDSNSAL